MKIAKFQFNMFGTNCYVVWSPKTMECMIVDPGMITPAENEAIDSFIADELLKVKYLVNTHLHLDHCFGNNHIAEKYGVTTMAHKADHFLGATLKQQSMLFGIKDPAIRDISQIEALSSDAEILLGDEIIRVIHVPGHSPGGIALYAPADGWIIVGDTIFAGGGIGRTDLTGGDYRTLIDSIENRLFTLPLCTSVLPGHGSSSTIEQEINSNPYV